MSAFKEGLKAFRRPEKQGNHYFLKSNPYPEGTNKNREWTLGFNKAYYSNLKKVRKHEQNRARS